MGDWRHRRKKGVKGLRCFNPETLAGCLPLAEMLRFRAALQPLKANARPRAHAARLHVDISHHRVCVLFAVETLWGIRCVTWALPAPSQQESGAPDNHSASWSFPRFRPQRMQQGWTPDPAGTQLFPLETQHWE